MSGSYWPDIDIGTLTSDAVVFYSSKIFYCPWFLKTVEKSTQTLYLQQLTVVNCLDYQLFLLSLHCNLVFSICALLNCNIMAFTSLTDADLEELSNSSTDEASVSELERSHQYWVWKRVLWRQWRRPTAACNAYVCGPRLTLLAMQ